MDIDFLLFFQICSATIVLISLLYGAIMDIQTRKSPKWIWIVVFPFAMSSTVLWYIVNFYWNGFNAILSTFITSLVLCTFCYIFAIKRGNGGDWRALYYVSLLTPWFAPMTLLFACLVGLVQTGIDYLRKSPIKSAWMVSITIAFILSVVAKVFIL